MSKSKNPIFEKQELFLKVLIEGSASLFSYESTNLKRYFYKNENTTIEQLIYKSYLVSDVKIAENITFKQQLWNSLKCDKISLNDVKSVEYKKNNLMKLFINYNSCVNAEVINYVENQKSDQFNLTIRPGLNYSSLTIRNSKLQSTDTEFGSKLGLRIGLEAEYILPFNKSKWGLFIEPTYQYFIKEIERVTIVHSVIELTQNVKVNYKSIELPIGIRHYFFLNKNSIVFVNASVIIDMPLESTIDFESGTDLEIYQGVNLSFGVGYKFKNKFSTELRYQTSRDILNDYVFWNSDYNTFSFIIGYTIF